MACSRHPTGRLHTTRTSSAYSTVLSEANNRLCASTLRSLTYRKRTWTASLEITSSSFCISAMRRPLTRSHHSTRFSAGNSVSSDFSSSASPRSLFFHAFPHALYAITADSTAHISHSVDMSCTL